MQQFTDFISWLAMFTLKLGIGMVLVSIAFVVVVNSIRDAVVYVRVAQDRLWRERQRTALSDAEALNAKAISSFQLSFQKFRKEFSDDLSKRSEELRQIVSATQKGTVQ